MHTMEDYNVHVLLGNDTVHLLKKEKLDLSIEM